MTDRRPCHTTEYRARVKVRATAFQRTRARAEAGRRRVALTEADRPAAPPAVDPRAAGLRAHSTNGVARRRCDEARRRCRRTARCTRNSASNSARATCSAARRYPPVRLSDHAVGCGSGALRFADPTSRLGSSHRARQHRDADAFFTRFPEPRRVIAFARRAIIHAPTAALIYRSARYSPADTRVAELERGICGK